jgi:hypothetical protein
MRCEALIAVPDPWTIMFTVEGLSTSVFMVITRETGSKVFQNINNF